MVEVPGKNAFANASRTVPIPSSSRVSFSSKSAIARRTRSRSAEDESTQPMNAVTSRSPSRDRDYAIIRSRYTSIIALDRGRAT